MPDPSISLVLLTYNQSATVAEAVQSALGQIGDPIEIVITDDCSTDATFDVVQKTVRDYRGPHKVILNRNSENLGLAGNVNKAHDLSSGDIIIAAAGDDISLPLRATRIRDAFRQTKAMLVCSFADVIDMNGQPVVGEFHNALFYRDFDLAKVARSKSLYIGATGAWHRDAFERYGPLGPDCYEDVVMGFRAALENKVHVIREALVKYRLGHGLTSSDRYFTDIDAYRKRRLNGCVANKAVMLQRIKDSATAGFDENADVMRILRKEVIKADLGIACHTPGEFRKHALTHPFLALSIWHSERRRITKMQKQIAQNSRNAQSAS